MSGFILLLGYGAVAVFLIGLVYRARKIAGMPVHLRWELAPVPHEKGKSQYGGSFLEEVDWWTKPREKSLLNEAWYMFQEIVFLKGVYENKRKLWTFSFPFHFGLYLLIAMTGLLVLRAVLQMIGLDANIISTLIGNLITVLAVCGYIMGSIGTIGLIVMRLSNPDMKAFTNVASIFNLLFLASIFLSGGLAFLTTDGFSAQMTQCLKGYLTFNSGLIPSGILSLHIILAALFMIYLPFTYMMHFVAKYFTYHEVRWNDEPMEVGSDMEKEVEQLLGQTMTWAAPHIGADGKKNWVDIATTTPAASGEEK